MYPPAPTLKSLLVLFVAGVGTSLTPCIYPMIPITVGVLGGAGAAARSRSRVVALTLAYVAGFALVYALLGLLAGLTHTIFGTVSSNRWAYLVVANILLAAALAMFDVIPVRLPAWLLGWAAARRAGSIAGTFVMGGASGVIAAPCGAPAFAAVIAWIGVSQHAVWGFVSALVFSLGMTAVLVVAGLAAGALAALPRSGVWMLWVKRVAAVVILIMAEYYLVRAGENW